MARPGITRPTHDRKGPRQTNDMTDAKRAVVAPPLPEPREPAADTPARPLPRSGRSAPGQPGGRSPQPERCRSDRTRWSRRRHRRQRVACAPVDAALGFLMGVACARNAGCLQKRGPDYQLAVSVPFLWCAGQPDRCPAATGESKQICRRFQPRH